MSLFGVRRPLEALCRSISIPGSRGVATTTLKAHNVVVDALNDIERTLPPAVEEAHRNACAAGSTTYIDPDSGLTVFTRVAHMERGRCCGSRCRHCPYGHINVPERYRVPQATLPRANNTAAAVQAAYKSSVYTRTGDGGTSALFTGERRPKNDQIFDALGTVDELNSHIGLAKEQLIMQFSELKDPKINSVIDEIETLQQRLLDVGSIVATPSRTHRFTYTPDEWVKELEVSIDAMDKSLPPLTSFILPGGSVAAAQLHICRTVCRRAERAVVAVGGNPDYQTDLFLSARRFLNRLSDYLFVAARVAASKEVRREH